MRINTLSLKDGASTPIVHTFVPRNVQSMDGKGGVLPTLWSEPGATLLLNKNVTLSTVVNGNKTTVTRGQVKVPTVTPAKEGCCTTDTYSDGLFSFDFRIPPLYTEAEKANLLAFAASLLQDAVIKDAVIKGEVVY